MGHLRTHRHDRRRRNLAAEDQRMGRTSCIGFGHDCPHRRAAGDVFCTRCRAAYDCDREAALDRSVAALPIAELRFGEADDPGPVPPVDPPDGLVSVPPVPTDGLRLLCPACGDVHAWYPFPVPDGRDPYRCAHCGWPLALVHLRLLDQVATPERSRAWAELRFTVVGE